LNQYTYESLISAFIESRKKQIHPDFNTYYLNLLDVLEVALAVPLTEKRVFSPDGPRQAQSLWHMFADAVDAYLGVHTPWDTFLSNGAMMHRLPSYGADGQQVFAYAYHISGIAKQFQQVHLDLIYHLFKMMHGKVDAVVTSADLQRLGFDDSNEPRAEDYAKEA
jgi:hypothetical protein